MGEPAARRGVACREGGWGCTAGRVGGAAQLGRVDRAAQQGGWAGLHSLGGWADTAGRVGGAAQLGRVGGAAQQGGWVGLHSREGRWAGFLLSFPDGLFLSPDCILPSPCLPVPRFLPLLPPLPFIPLSYLQIFIIGPDHCPDAIVCVCGEGLG